jgi:phospholipase C
MGRKAFILIASFLLFLVVNGCRGLGTSPTPITPTGGGTGGNSTPATSLNSINHIIYMLQENRSFDHYLGKLNDYKIAHGYPGSVDGLPPNASNPTFDGTGTVTSFHMVQKCSENVSAAWNESHVWRNRTTPSDGAPALMDGFVYTAAKFARDRGFVDTEGHRAMGYYDDTDFPFMYFMASNFATSDRWFAPAPTRTQPNRMYSLAATSQGHAYPPTGMTAKTIFQSLEEKGVSWKVYTTTPDATYLKYFDAFYQAHKDKVVGVDQYRADAANGTLPSVALIESGFEGAALDEHPENDVQKGAAYVADLINTLMNSQSWKDSVFILTYDEPGGFYDHVPPMDVPNPDGIPPQDLLTTDIHGDFTRTSSRVPLIVVSPFVKKNYVSHTPADYTAILKFIEVRFGLLALNNRDAAQMDMTEFFDFPNTPWATPPSPPAQPIAGPNNCSMLP